MGIIWRVTMPLLSTLAALVIIVHSSEDLDREYRHDLKGKDLDAELSSYEQQWRVPEPMMQESELSETSRGELHESPIRGRPSRKRKRRPPPDFTVNVQESKYYNLQELPTINDDYDGQVQEPTEMPRRRRKKLNIMPNRWIGKPIDSAIPIRRRIQRKKRPILDTWPILSEFGGLVGERDEENSRKVVKSDLVDEDRRVSDGHEDDDEYVNKEISVRISRPNVKLTTGDNEKELINEDKSLSEFSEEVMSKKDKHKNYLHSNIPYTESKLRDKSPKVFYDLEKAQEKTIHLELDKYFDFKSDYVSLKSERNMKNKYRTSKDLMEEIKSYDKYNGAIDLRSLLKKSNKNLYDSLSKAKDKLGIVKRRSSFLEEAKHLLWDEEFDRNDEPIDPQTLKDILKRSNGTSLSEVLQQHNLTLADLLSKKENVLALLKSEKSLLTLNTNRSLEENISDGNLDLSPHLPNEHIEKAPIQYAEENNGNYSTKDVNSVPNNKYTLLNKSNQLEEKKKNNISTENVLKDNVSQEINHSDTLSIHQKNISTIFEGERSSTGMLVKRRFPGPIRRKLRMRPTILNFKSQLNRDSIELSPRRYVHHNKRNSTKAKEWKDITPFMPNENTTRDDKEFNEETTTISTSIPEDATTVVNENETITSLISGNTDISDVQNETVTPITDILESTTIAIEIDDTELYFNVTEQPINISSVKPAVKLSGLRRQAYNNRLQRKRLKHKTSTTESPPDDIMRNILNMGDFVSSSEFIARTQLPKFTSTDNFKETATKLEDFMTTESTRQTSDDLRTEKPHSYKTTLKLSKTHTHNNTSTKFSQNKNQFKITTEATAKFEIQEILNDTRTSAKLSNILRERNMTLRELLDHRERGSSHVHLADIFHNASREPNPPEPFLSKSLLEPISKETYPLRALLDANLHDTSTKAATIDPDALLTNNINIPIIMDFGNNVNENSDNMGIISMFNNKTNDTGNTKGISLQQDSEGKLYQSTIISGNATIDENDVRESRMLDVGNQEDLVNWNEIFAMIRNHNKNNSTTLGKLPTETEDKIIIKEDIDGEGLIVLEDLQHLRDLDNMITSKSEEDVEFNSYESDAHDQSIQNKFSSSAKSVTIATVTIVGLAMVLFLLTYAALKWKHQRALNHKHGYREERIPTPVFENRKVKKNCSSRSISPMLASSNIYTMSTLDSKNGKDSPEYMWDTLRKPFQ